MIDVIVTAVEFHDVVVLVKRRSKAIKSTASDQYLADREQVWICFIRSDLSFLVLVFCLSFNKNLICCRSRSGLVVSSNSVCDCVFPFS